MKVIICVIIIIILMIVSQLYMYIACSGGIRFLREPLRLINDNNIDRVCEIPHQNEYLIPKEVYITSHIPRERIPDLLGNHVKGFNINFYDDELALKFMKEHYPQFVDTYSNIKLGAHRADLWRYCILYKYGGVYLDVKVIPHVDLTKFNEYTDRYTWYAVMGAFRTEVFNAVLASPPQNPMIWQCILHIIRHPSPTWYHQYIHYLLMIIEDNYERPIETGIYERDDSRLVVWQEICRVTPSDGDVYGMSCRIFDNEGQLLFNSRDPKYPWK
tara:strand:+ start:564 stop:1379 length:816 start_codon:yes stop_codon:yes gene_type:complete